MATQVIPSETFQKELKRLARKFPAVLSEVETLSNQLKSDERPGDKIPNIAQYQAYKVRLKNPSAQKGKRGGFRVIYYVYAVDAENTVVLLTIYSKTIQENIPSEEIIAFIEDSLLDDAENDESE